MISFIVVSTLICISGVTLITGIHYFKKKEITKEMSREGSLVFRELDRII